MKKSKLFGTIAIGLLGIGASASAIGLLSTSCSQNNSATEDSSSVVANNETLNNAVLSIYNSVNDKVFAPIKNESLAEKGPKLVPTSLKEKNEDQIKTIINKEFNSKFFGDGSDYVDSINFEINRYNDSATVVVKLLKDKYEIKTTTINDNIVISENNNSFSLTYGDMGIGNYVTKDDLNTLYDCANKFLSDTYNNNKLAMSTDNILEPWKETGFQMLKDAGFNTNLLSDKTSPFTITYETNTINASITLQSSESDQPIVYAKDVPGVEPDKPQAPDENGNPQTDNPSEDTQAGQGNVEQGGDSSGNKEPTVPAPSSRDTTTENGVVGNETGQNDSPTKPVEQEQSQQKPEANNDPYNFSIAEKVGTMTFDPTKTVGDNSVDYNFDNFLDSKRLNDMRMSIHDVLEQQQLSTADQLKEIAQNNTLMIPINNKTNFSEAVWDTMKTQQNSKNFVANNDAPNDYSKWPKINLTDIVLVDNSGYSNLNYTFNIELPGIVCTVKTNKSFNIQYNNQILNISGKSSITA